MAVPALQADDRCEARVRPTGGVYFVQRRHAGTLAALRELVRRMGAGSHLARVPLPDQEEMREMVITAFTTKSREDLDRLARDIATAQRDGDTTPAAIQALHKRFRDLHAATAEHAQLLNTSLDDTTAALTLVNAQLASLLAQAS
jgi:septal ring factor EnvC (AmiA/AmiB activator)